MWHSLDVCVCMWRTTYLRVRVFPSWPLPFHIILFWSPAPYIHLWFTLVSVTENHIHYPVTSCALWWYSMIPESTLSFIPHAKSAFLLYIHTFFFSAAFYFYSLCVHLLLLILRWVRGSEHERYQVMMYALEALHTVRDVRLRGCLLWRAASNPNCMYSICIIFVLSIKLWECASGEMTQSIYVHFVYSCIFCGGDSRVWE